MNPQVLSEIEASIQGYQVDVDLGKALDRLVSNRDFKQVVMNGYLEKEAIRLVHLKAAPHMKSEADQREVLSQIEAIGRFQQYLFGIRTSVEMAQKGIEAAELTRDEILSEG